MPSHLEHIETGPGSEHPQGELLLRLQKEILEAVALGNNPDSILTELCRAAESMLPDSVSSIMILNEHRTALSVRAAPGLPNQAIDQLNGLVPGPAAGSCGTAVYLNEPCYVCNTMTDQRWAEFGQFARDFNVCACWSHPIHTKDDRVIGSFALSSFATRSPNEFQKQLLSICANVAGIILQREKQEKELWCLAHLDKLTGAPNRVLLDLRLEQAMKHARRHSSQLALLYIDLDNFKDINDSYGHKVGDDVLRAAASLIQDQVRSGDTLSRYGGDEFILLLEDMSDTYDAITIGEKIKQSFCKPLPLEPDNIVITTSIGISVFPEDARDTSTLLKNADVAMYRAKSQGRNQIVFYEPAMTQAIETRVRLEAELRQAVKNRAFILHYQPQFPAATARMVSVETLVRWQHPQKGLLSPAEFIPVAERTGLIDDIGRQVLHQACKQAREWLDTGLPLESVAVNYSVRQIRPGCHREILETLSATGLPPGKLEIEVTESLMMENSATAIAELAAIRAAGISVALDDFGTGHSSLSQLKSLPVDRLKIDRSFVSDLPGNHDDAIIARTIIAMGHSLGLEVVAEGVETGEQLQFLLNEGCDAFQGYYLATPLPSEKIDTDLLTSKLD